MFAIYTLNISEIIDLQYIPAYYLVIFVWGLFGLYLINPLPIFNFKSRLFMLKLALKSILAPILGVTFPVIWMTDQLISLITPFKDFAYTICYFKYLSIDKAADVSNQTCNSASRI